MKNFIITLSLTLSLTLLSIFTIQAQSTPYELGKSFADALIKNDTSTFYDLYPDYKELMVYAAGEGFPMPPEDEIQLIKNQALIALSEFKSQIQELRKTAIEEGFDWSTIEVGELIVEKEVEEIEEGKEMSYDVIYITFQQGDASFDVYFATFKVGEIFKIALFIESDLLD